MTDYSAIPDEILHPSVLKKRRGKNFLRFLENFFIAVIVAGAVFVAFYAGRVWELYQVIPQHQSKIERTAK